MPIFLLGTPFLWNAKDNIEVRIWKVLSDRISPPCDLHGHNAKISLTSTTKEKQILLVLKSSYKISWIEIKDQFLNSKVRLLE